VTTTARPAARQQVLRDQLVVATFALPGHDRTVVEGYEVCVASAKHAPLTSLLTRRVEVYAIAAAAEGYDQRFTVRFHHAQRQDGKPCRVIDDLEMQS
jgi:hypothetical protein